MTCKTAEMPKLDNRRFGVSLQSSLRLSGGAKDSGGCGRAQRQVENKSVIRQWRVKWAANNEMSFNQLELTLWCAHEGKTLMRKQNHQVPPNSYSEA